MATNNLNPTAQHQAQPVQSLLSGLAVKAEHMIALGCGGLLIVLFSCAFGVWWFIDSWTTSADPTPQQRTERHVEIPDCTGRGRLMIWTDQRGNVVKYDCEANR